ncbi:hypothetical protein [Pirellulimonas nuda]|uniref:hypothetical protein n=1 Tax=Pirellulimonas nuda TaxID=2528009 RepID=UPI0018D40FDC|nr:hypothetical protein [Pirellulimonas nuda]
MIHSKDEVLSLSSEQNLPPPTPSDQPDDWPKVEEELFRVGVDDAAGAIAAARAAGASPRCVRRLIAVWSLRRTEWAPYDHVRLYHRVRRAKRDDDPELGWPPPSADYRDAQARQASVVRRAAEVDRIERRRVENKRLREKNAAEWREKSTSLVDELRAAKATSGIEQACDTHPP